jgi:hypothetical protein
MCETAAHQFLRCSWKYDGKELDDMLRLMKHLNDTTDGDVGLGKAFVSTDGEVAEKETCEGGAGFGAEHGIEFTGMCFTQARDFSPTWQRF